MREELIVICEAIKGHQIQNRGRNMVQSVSEAPIICTITQDVHMSGLSSRAVREEFI